MMEYTCLRKNSTNNLERDKPIIRRGVQSRTWKTTVPPKEQIPTWNEISYVPEKL